MPSPADTERQSSPTDLCHYCGKAPGDDACSYDVDFHTDVVRFRNSPKTCDHRFKHEIVRVPRCARCKEKQEAPSRSEQLHFAMSWGVAIVAFVASIVVLVQTGAGFDDTPSLIIFGLIAAGILAAIYHKVFDRSEALSLALDIKTACEGAWEHPAILRLRDQGWSFGVEPSSRHPPAGGEGYTFGSIPNFGYPLPAEEGGCPLCRRKVWWNGNSCGLCDAPHEAKFTASDPQLGEALKRFASLEGLVKVNIVKVIEDAWRAEAATMLLHNGLDAHQSRLLVLALESQLRENRAKGK